MEAETLDKSSKFSESLLVDMCYYKVNRIHLQPAFDSPVSPGKELKSFSPLPLRHQKILLQYFSAIGVKNILLALIDHKYYENGINLSFHLSFIKIIQIALIYYTSFSYFWHA